jgi:hypothetical protein
MYLNLQLSNWNIHYCADIIYSKPGFVNAQGTEHSRNPPDCQTFLAHGVALHTAALSLILQPPKFNPNFGKKISIKEMAVLLRCMAPLNGS